MPLKGYDCFFPDPGTEQTMYCRVCKTECNVQRNVYGPTSSVAAMAKKFRLHDLFICPHADTGWHEKALRLVIAIDKTPSKRVAHLMQQDLEDLLQENHIR